MYFIDGMVIDSLQNIPEPDERIDAMQFTGTPQGVKHGTSFGSIMASRNKAQVIKSLENNEVDFSLVLVMPDNMKLNKLELMQNQL